MLSFRRTLACAAFLLAAPALAQDLTPAETAQVDKIVADSLASSGVPSASIAIVRGGKIVYAKAYGDQGPGLPVTTADAKYPIASVSKQFTAAAILMLRDEGKLSLDDTVSKYVPGITGGDRITIRQLLSHTAGLQDYWPQDYSFAAMETPTTPQAIADRWAKKPLDFQPGTAWQYSNTGYVVAGMIIEKASGKPLLKYLDAKIFKPLGMKPVDQDKAIGKGFPQPTHRFALGPVRPAKPAADNWLWAAGELAMSASDLAKWDIARMDRTLLPAADWSEQETEIKLSDGKGTKYGLGVSIDDRDGKRVISHGGEAVGFLSENIVIPEDRFAVIALVNADFGRAQDSIANGVVDLLHPKLPVAVVMSEDDVRDSMARKLFDQLRTGALDRSVLTENAAYYFDATVTGDYRDSLGALGPVTSFAPRGKARLRGGFVNRNYLIEAGGKKLLAITYAEAGAKGRFEQFIVMPVD